MAPVGRGSAWDVPMETVEAAVDALLGVAARSAEPVRLEISTAQLRALRAVHEARAMNLRQLADELGTIPSWASRLCDRLVAGGFLERRSSEHNRREVVLIVRPDGERLLAELSRRRQAALAELLDLLGPADRRSLLRGLTALLAAAASQAEDGTAGRKHA